MMWAEEEVCCKSTSDLRVIAGYRFLETDNMKMMCYFPLTGLSVCFGDNNSKYWLMALTIDLLTQVELSSN